VQVAYYVASLVVLYSPEAQTQRHYRGHTEDVECIAVHPQVSWSRTEVTTASRTHCAPLGKAGARERRARHMSRHVRFPDSKKLLQVWDYETLELVHILGLGEITNRVACLAFSIRGEVAALTLF
jgi:microtubule-associated protein-like 1/2